MTTVNMIILDLHAERYREALEKKFPELRIDTVKATINHQVIEEEKLASLIPEADILFATKIQDEYLSRAARLQWIQTRTSGVDWILNLPSLSDRVLVTSARGIHKPQMSEIAFLLMLALNWKFGRIVKNRLEKRWERWPPTLLYRKTVGILGMGAIGEEIARKCRAFGMTVLGVARTESLAHAVDRLYPPSRLSEVLGQVDYLIILLPKSPETEKMIGAPELSSMKKSACLVNLGRGEVIDDDALIDALNRGLITGAALDTFWKEPLPEDHPFWAQENLLMTPHIGGLSDIYVEQVLSILEENLSRFLKGERETLVNLVRR